MKVSADRILYTKNDLPIDALYEYAPRPPNTELPHIHPHEFEMALLPHCKESCVLSFFHDCVELRTGTMILRRIPKRRQALQLKVNDPEEAWGLNAHYTPHFLRVFLYHCLVLAGTVHLHSGLGGWSSIQTTLRMLLFPLLPRLQLLLCSGVLWPLSRHSKRHVNHLDWTIVT
jgi:hypothetical protein